MRESDVFPALTDKGRTVGRCGVVASTGYRARGKEPATAIALALLYF